MLASLALMRSCHPSDAIYSSVAVIRIIFSPILGAFAKIHLPVSRHLIKTAHASCRTESTLDHVSYSELVFLPLAERLHIWHFPTATEAHSSSLLKRDGQKLSNLRSLKTQQTPICQLQLWLVYQLAYYLESLDKNLSRAANVSCSNTY